MELAKPIKRFIWGDDIPFDPVPGEEIPLTHEEQIKLRFKHMADSAKFSPDIIKLERQRRQLIFVADDMMRHGKLHSYISEFSLTGRFPIYAGFTEALMYMWKKDLGEDSYPVILDKDVTGHYFGPKLEAAKVRGEVYSIRSFQFRKLDTLRENGYAFTRRRIWLTIPRYKVRYSKTDPLPGLQDWNARLETWAYIGNHDYWDDQLAGVLPSSPVPIVEDHGRAWLKRYYLHKNE